MRVGLGYDIHRTQSGSSIVLGGVTFDAPFSLVGHSDADALLHAITDAILGALADYDIGYYFPPSKEENKKRASSDFLFFAVERMRTRGYAIENIDCNVICEVPKIQPVREKIRQNLAKLLSVDIERVSVKGRTKEKVDAVGRGEALECQAVVLLSAKAGDNAVE